MSDLSPTGPLSQAFAAKPGPRPDRVEATAKKFEAVLLNTLLEGMAPQAGVLGVGGTTGDIYGSLLREQYARLLAERGGIGLAESLERTMRQMGATA